MRINYSYSMEDLERYSSEIKKLGVKYKMDFEIETSNCITLYFDLKNLGKILGLLRVSEFIKNVTKELPELYCEVELVALTDLKSLTFDFFLKNEEEIDDDHLPF